MNLMMMPHMIPNIASRINNKFFDEAMKGYNQFRKDFVVADSNNNDDAVAVFGPPGSGRTGNGNCNGSSGLVSLPMADSGLNGRVNRVTPGNDVSTAGQSQLVQSQPQQQQQYQKQGFEKDVVEFRTDYGVIDRVTFDVDERLLMDVRPVRNNLYEPGQREYKLFDDYLNDVVRNVYNVNSMDITNPWEISGRKLFPRSVERWPIDFNSSDWSEVRKNIVMMKTPCGGGGSLGGIRTGGQQQQHNSQSRQEKRASQLTNGKVGISVDVGYYSPSSETRRSSGPGMTNNLLNHTLYNPTDYDYYAHHERKFFDLNTMEDEMGATAKRRRREVEEEGAGAFGLASLAKLLHCGDGVDQNPFGFLTFTGMNLHKLMKDLDRTTPITPTFAGPLADHNYTLDYGSIEVTKPFEVYNLPFQPDWNVEERSSWK